MAIKNVTLTEIAALAGVSMKTVSRVLNGEANVRDQTREKVKRAAKELYYKSQNMSGYIRRFRNPNP